MIGVIVGFVLVFALFMIMSAVVEALAVDEQ